MSLKKYLAVAGFATLSGIGGYYLFNHLRASSSPAKKSKKNSVDVSSFSNLDEVITKMIHLDISLDFEKRNVTGSVILEMESLVNSLKEVDLDVKALKINEVFINGEKVKFKVNVLAGKEELGQQLNVEFSRTFKLGQTFTLSVHYESNVTEESNAWNWLTPEQTLGKKLPYLFTQCQPTFCRSIFPCQDSPSIKSKYTARVTSPADLKVYMSAKLNKTTTQDGTRISEFSQDIPVPSYLVALVAGDLELTKISQRTAVITEPGKTEDCVKELADMETYLSALEDYAFPYVWGEYNIVILPPSFPYGGMENPLLTFASPSIITGDKSNTDVVIHEMAHSWSGNLVGCKNWTEFWLNEGITVYLERQIVRRLRGEEAYKLASYIGHQSLNEAVNAFGPEHNFTSLQPDLSKCHPDDAFSVIPYEKGFQFLTYLEQKIGVDNIQKFLRLFFTHFMYRSLGTNEFKELFKVFCIDLLGNDEGTRIYNSVAWDQWINQPGMPFHKFDFDSEDRKLVLELVEEFINCDENLIPEKFEHMRELLVEQRIIFLKELIVNQEKISKAKVQFLDSKSGLSFETNPEIIQPWYILAIKKDLRDNFPSCAEFLGQYGRLKYIKPIYCELAKADKNFAIEVFNHYKNSYHSISVQVLKKILGC